MLKVLFKCIEVSCLLESRRVYVVGAASISDSTSRLLEPIEIAAAAIRPMKWPVHLDGDM